MCHSPARFGCLTSASVALWSALLLVGSAGAALHVGFAQQDITPRLQEDRPVWIAGYGHNRRATGIHDPLYCRAVVLQDTSQGASVRKMALVSVDLVGMQLAEVRRIRDRLPEFDYVLVASTHNHEGPDIIGLWGPSVWQSGVDREYLQMVTDRVVQAVREATRTAVRATAEFGIARAEDLVRDSRLPVAKDGLLRVLRFSEIRGNRQVGILVQWNCHPEALGPRNTLLTADFVAATAETLSASQGAPVAYFTGAVGGLMAPPHGGLTDSSGRVLEEGDFRYAEAYGVAIAKLAEGALRRAEPIRLVPFRVASRPVQVPMVNPYYALARCLGVVKRTFRIWPEGAAPFAPAAQTAVENETNVLAVETEVACLRLGELHVACIPGEIYPELIYGTFQQPFEPGVDFPDSPLETPLTQLLPDGRFLVFGLANDEIGYIIPKRQWDHAPPFAYQRTESQYGEINSVGPDVAPILMQALEQRVGELDIVPQEP